VRLIAGSRILLGNTMSGQDPRNFWPVVKLEDFFFLAFAILFLDFPAFGWDKLRRKLQLGTHIQKHWHLQHH
jgi:hypothetical protein